MAVYIMNQGTHDYRDANKFSEQMIVLTEGAVPVFRTDNLTKALKEGLNNYTEQDFLLISGPAILSFLCAGILFKRFSYINVLLFDAKGQKYVMRQLRKGAIE